MKKRQSSRRPESHEQAPIVGVVARIQAQRPNFAERAAQIADVILKDPSAVVRMSVTDLATASGSSDGTVVNFCKAIGLSGFQQLKLSLAYQSFQPVQLIHEDLAKGDTTDRIRDKIFASGIQALRDTLSVLKPASIDKAVKLIRGARRVQVFGIGSAAPIADDAAYRMIRIGIDARSVVDSHIQAVVASGAGSDTTTLTISHSGSTVETVAATRLARDSGASTIVLTNHGRSPIQEFADVLLYTMAHETSFKTEAMTSRIAQLCVLDVLIAALAFAAPDASTKALRRSAEVISSKRF
jgi:DNA-binding MurR/RpiR family transcriptional regulator